jgi:hypothetical protein
MNNSLKQSVNMKTIRLLNQLKLMIALITLTGFSIHAQPPEPRPGPSEADRDKVEALKIGFLTRKLDLTSEEAKTFWPVYNKFQEELESLRKQRRSEMQSLRENKKDLSDSEAEKLVDNEITFRQKELDVIKKYHAQFKQILPVKKVLMLYRSEEEFKRELLERLRNRKDGHWGPPPRRR